MTIIFLAGCDGHTRLVGQISDSGGQKVGKANVSLSTLGLKVIDKSTVDSGADGTYEVGLTHPPGIKNLKLRVSKDGFLVHEEIVDAGGQRDINVVLSK